MRSTQRFQEEMWRNFDPPRPRKKKKVTNKMNIQLIPDSQIPKQFELDGRCWIVIDLLQNLHYRALLLPVGGGDPRWISNDKLLDLVGQH